MNTVPTRAWSRTMVFAEISERPDTTALPLTSPLMTVAKSSIRALPRTAPPSTRAFGPTNALASAMAFGASQPPPFGCRRPFGTGAGALGWKPSGMAPLTCTIHGKR